MDVEFQNNLTTHGSPKQCLSICNFTGNFCELLSL